MTKLQDNIQLSLGLSEFYRTKTVPATGTGRERFESFHELNPHVYKALVTLARKLKSQGYKRVGMKALFEFLRMNKMLHTVGSKFKLNNDFTARYARLIDSQENDLSGIFEMRERRAG